MTTALPATRTLDSQTLLRIARNLDREERLSEAACAYEAVVRVTSASLETYLNLALVYLSAGDPAIAAHHGIAADFRKYASVRFEEVLLEALDRWPDNVEAWFWLQYSERVYENGPCFLAECEAKVRGSEDLVPCAYLAMARGEGAYAQQIRAMRVLASVQLTSRMRYIQRMIG